MRTMSAQLSVALVILALVTSSCHRAPEQPVAVIVVCDLSASIEPEARAAMFQSVEAIVHRMQRGDSVIVIPVTGDSIADASGHVLRIETSGEREVFDEDLIRLSRNARSRLEQVATTANSNPATHTDLLGALQLASEEASALPRDKLVVLVVLSDFIQDNSGSNFNSDPSLSQSASAKTYALDVARRTPLALRNTPAYLGFLRSRDFARLGDNRRNAIRAFWREYLLRQGVQPEFASDGPGLLERFLDRFCGTRQKRGVAG